MILSSLSTGQAERRAECKEAARREGEGAELSNNLILRQPSLALLPSLLSPAEWSILIGRDCRDPVLSLVEPYHAGAKVYAIKTHLTFRCIVMA